MPTPDNYIQGGIGGTMFAEPGAFDYFRAATLLSALGLLTKGISPTRGLTLTKALAMASEYTGTPYKRTEIDRACADLKVVIEVKRASIPVLPARVAS